MASNNFKEIESLKEKCAVRNNPFFLSLSKGSAVARIPEIKSLTKENVNPLSPEHIDKCMLNATNLSAKNSSVCSLCVNH
jgi:hypothetical protein